jgi:RNA recognition motif-containing protein
MKDPHTKDPRGFAFVTMETPEEADAAIQGMNATEFLGKMISVERVSPLRRSESSVDFDAKARRGRARTRLSCSFPFLLADCFAQPLPVPTMDLPSASLTLAAAAAAGESSPDVYLQNSRLDKLRRPRPL